MKRQIKRWTIRVAAAGVFIAGLLLIIVLNPILTYAHKTVWNNYTVFHNSATPPAIQEQLEEATRLVKTSEYYSPGLKLDICLNDGSRYPKLMACIRGRAFAWGFYDKVVLMGVASYKDNYVALNGYRWNLAQLIAHEMVHCYQFSKRGLRKSNPLAGIPEWKWEGYPEYIARQRTDQRDLAHNIEHLLATEQTDHNGWIQFADSTGTVIPYYKAWLLVQYCMDIRHMSYAAIIDDTTSEEAVRVQMMEWYNRQTKQAAID